MRLPFFNWPPAQFLAMLLSMLISEQSFAQQQNEKTQPTDNKFEASGYLVQADRELECNPEGARVWAKKALDTAASARETDPAMIDTLGDLKSQSNIKIAEAEKRLEELNDTAEQARGLVKQARLATAQARLQHIDPKGCYPGLKLMRSEIDARKSKADVLVKQGDAVLNRNRKEAIKLYAGARQIDAEYGGLDEKTSLAKNPVIFKQTTGQRPTTLNVCNIAISFGGSTFFVDGRPIVKLRSLRCAELKVDPGTRHLQIGSNNSAVVDLEIQEGQTITVPVIGGQAPHVRILVQDIPHGQQTIQRLRTRPADDKDILASGVVLR